MYRKTAEELLEFIEKGKTSYHTVEAVSQQLEESGYERLQERQRWSIKGGGRYYVTRNGSSLIAFHIPKEQWRGFSIVASHSDSPSFKVKEQPEMEADGGYIRLNVEKYGRMIYSSWFDRPLSVAGRIAVKEGNNISTRLVDINRDLAVIPNLAIHMNSELNGGYKYNAQTDFLPVVAQTMEEGGILSCVAEAAKVGIEEIVGYDLFLYNREKGSIWGVDEAFISAPRLDDLQCAYGTLQGFLKAEHPRNIAVYALFDNEEVGSGTKQGAASTFLEDTLRRINLSLKRDEEQYYMALAESFMISADNAHGIHPNHPEKADPTNKPRLNGGIVIKHNASQRYTSDAVSAAVIKNICEKADIPHQSYVNRSDIAGGSTLGNISNTKVSVNTVDVGLAQLAMHSAYETAGIKDTEYLIKMTEAFYRE